MSRTCAVSSTVIRRTHNYTCVRFLPLLSIWKIKQTRFSFDNLTESYTGGNGSRLVLILFCLQNPKSLTPLNLSFGVLFITTSAAMAHADRGVATTRVLTVPIPQQAVKYKAFWFE